MEPSVSAVITSFNRPDLLVFTLKALARQKRGIDEAVVADDGSTADVLGALTAARPQLPFPIVFVRQENKGFRVGKSRNNAIRRAKGDFLVFFDQDIAAPPGYVSTFLENAREKRFLVSFPVRLTRAESDVLMGDITLLDHPERLTSPGKTAVITKQWRKDFFYAVMHAMKLRAIGPKLRSGVFGAWRKDLLAVNGFDEEYLGWGNEDDDLGHRLHACGVDARNPFRRTFPLHLWHEPNNMEGVRPNLDLYRKRLVEIKKGKFRAVHGVENPLGGDESVVTVL